MQTTMQQRLQGRNVAGRSVAPSVPAHRSFHSHRAATQTATISAAASSTTKLPASHLESSKKALDSLKQQAVNRKWPELLVGS